MKKKIAYGVTGLILGCIFLFPIYILIMNSFKTTKGIFTDVLGFPAKGTFTLENYKNAFQELDYIRSFMNSLLITVVTAVLVLLISAMAAWVLVRSLHGRSGAGWRRRALTGMPLTRRWPSLPPTRRRPAARSLRKTMGAGCARADVIRSLPRWRAGGSATAPSGRRWSSAVKRRTRTEAGNDPPRPGGNARALLSAVHF